MRIGFLVRRDFRIADAYDGVASVEDALLEESFVVVTEEGRYRGLLCADDVLRSPRAILADCLRDRPAVDADTEIPVALERMKEARTTTLPVLHHGEFLGVCVRSDIAEYLESYRRELEQHVERSTAELQREIARRGEAEEALRRSEREYREIVETAAEGVWVLDAEGRTTFVNRPLAQALGSTPEVLLGRTPADFVFDVDRGEYARRAASLQAGRPEQFEVRLRRSDGQTVWFLVSATPRQDERGGFAGVLAMLTDVTERRRLVEQMHHAQKMEALGTLAGGIAHDFNNILTPVMAHADLLLYDLPPQSPARQHGEQILHAAERARQLVQQILSLSRRQPERVQPLDLRPLVNEALKLLRASIPTTIEIREHLAADPGIVVADPAQAHQVLMNLCTNARHAMRESGGVLEVSLDPCDLGSDAAAVGVPPGPYVRLGVSDTGTGMDPQTLERIFEPYFTTKPPGEGTGLGLAVVRGIVSNWGGAVAVASEAGHGSRFDVYLPRHAAAAPPAVAEAERPPRGTERVLCVDDEPAIAEIAASMLRALGYQVTSTTSTLEALDRVRAAPDDFDLVLTDQTLPRMTGAELTRELLGLRPELPVLITTGYSESLDEAQALALGARGLVSKPFTFTSLAQAVRRALDGAERGAAPDSAA